VNSFGANRRKYFKSSELSEMDRTGQLDEALSMRSVKAIQPSRVPLHINLGLTSLFESQNHSILY
jgi:hypothetical protein